MVSDDVLQILVVKSEVTWYSLESRDPQDFLDPYMAWFSAYTQRHRNFPLAQTCWRAHHISSNTLSEMRRTPVT